MYGLTRDDFTYKDISFRWVLSPNRFIYRVYHESELIGTIPVSQVRARMLPKAIEALYPICDKWIETLPVVNAPSVFIDESVPPILGASLTAKQWAVKRQEVVDELLSPDDTISEYVLKAAAIEIAAAKKKRATKVVLTSNLPEEMMTPVKAKKKRATKKEMAERKGKEKHRGRI